MKNKILLEELTRIQGLMGKSLINEQWTAIAKTITVIVALKRGPRTSIRVGVFNCCDM